MVSKQNDMLDLDQLDKIIKEYLQNELDVPKHEYNLDWLALARYEHITEHSTLDCAIANRSELWHKLHNPNIKTALLNNEQAKAVNYDEFLSIVKNEFTADDLYTLNSAIDDSVFSLSFSSFMDIFIKLIKNDDARELLKLAIEKAENKNNKQNDFRNVEMISIMLDECIKLPSEPFFRLNTDYSDETILTAVKARLKSMRKGNDFKRLRQKQIEQLIKNKVLPCMDLMIYQKITGQKFTDKQVAEMLFTDLYDIDILDKYKHQTKPVALIALSGENLRINRKDTPIF